MAALYDPRYDYPNKRRQSFIGSLRDLDKRNEYLRKLHPDTVPPAQAAPALTPSHLTGTKMGSAPPALTEAQLHARRTEPAVNMHYDANNNLVPANTASINAYQGDIVSDNTNKTGAYLNSLPTAREEAAAEAHRRKMLTPSAEMYGNAMQVGGNSNLPPNDPDAVYMSLVKRYLDEGYGQKEAEAKAEAQMEKSRLQLFKENSAELGTFMMDKLGPDGERNYWPYIPWSDTQLAHNGLVIEGFDGEQIAKFGGENTQGTAAINDANNSSTEQDPAAITGPFMGGYGQDSLPPAPALTTQDKSGTGNTVVTKDNGALTASSKPTQSTVRSTTGGYTGNARGSDLPDMQIGLNERLMRMGAAGLAAGGQGSLAQMGAMFGASADVNQANRQAEMEAFGIEEERRQAHAARVAALAASKNKGAGGGDIGSVGDVRMGMAKIQNAIDMFDADTDSSMTGYNPSALFSRFIGRTVGNEDEARRLFLNELRLDSIMERVGETKGAISDAEMRLFASQAPELNSNGIVWKSWLQRQLQMQQIILNRLQTGQRIDPNAPITETMPNLDTGGGVSTDSTTQVVEGGETYGVRELKKP